MRSQIKEGDKKGEPIGVTSNGDKVFKNIDIFKCYGGDLICWTTEMERYGGWGMRVR